MSTADAAAQIHKLEQHVDGLRRALNRARMLRLLILVVLIVMVVAIVYSFLGLANRVRSEAFINDVTTHAQKHVADHQDDYRKEVQAFVDNSYPVVSKAFTAQAQNDLPKFTEAFNKERDAFVVSLRERMDEKLAIKYKELLKQHEDMIVAEFPELKDPATRERVLVNFQMVIEKLVKRNYGDQFDAESKKLIALWESFPAAEEPGPNDSKLEEKLLEHALQVAAGVMTTIQQENTASAPLAPAANPSPTEGAPAASTAAALTKAPGEGRKLPLVEEKPAEATPEETKPVAETTEAPKTEAEKPKDEPAPGASPAGDTPKG